MAKQQTEALIEPTQRKPQLNNNGVIVEYNSEDELKAAIALLSQNDDALLSRLSIYDQKILVGRDLIRTLAQTLQQQNLTQAEEADIVNRILSTLLALSLGFNSGARLLCNNTATGGAFTLPRKTFILQQIDSIL